MNTSNSVRRKTSAVFIDGELLTLTYQNNQAKEDNVDKEVSRLREPARRFLKAT